MVENIFDLPHVLDASASPKVLGRSLCALGFDECCFVPLGLVAPRQLDVQEVEHHVVERPHVVSPRQLLLQVSIQTRVHNSPSELGSLGPRDHLPILMEVLLGNAEVDEVKAGVSVALANDEVRRLDVPMDESFGVD